MKIKIEESPYGDAGTVYDGMLGMIQHWILQLESFRSPHKTKAESDYLEADIRGYREVLATGQEETAQAFARVKGEARMSGRRFENNEAVVEYLKQNGMWKCA